MARAGRAPRTSAWEGLKKALKGNYEDSVWDHLAGTTSSPFEAGDYGKIAVKAVARGFKKVFGQLNQLDVEKILGIVKK